MEAKSFSFSYDGYHVEALAYLYEDGNLKEIEIESIWIKDTDLLAVYRTNPDWDKYVHGWMHHTIERLKRAATAMLNNSIHSAAAPYVEYNFLN